MRAAAFAAPSSAAATTPARRIQGAVRGWLVRRCLEPPPGQNIKNYYIRRVLGGVHDAHFVILLPRLVMPDWRTASAV